jgi:hypothetical protein
MEQATAESGGGKWLVVTYFANGTEKVSKPLSYYQAYTQWERKNKVSKRRIALRRAA